MKNEHQISLKVVAGAGRAVRALKVHPEEYMFTGLNGFVAAFLIKKNIENLIATKYFWIKILIKQNGKYFQRLLL